MSSDASEIYDPEPLDLEIAVLEGMGLDGLQVSDTEDPRFVKFLAWNYRMTLSRLRSSEARLVDATEENRELAQQQEDLRIELARLSERVKGSLLEIPISMLSGFAANMILIDTMKTPGWVMLVVSLVLLAFLRSSEIGKVWNALRKCGERG
jgi:hypothetical protein